MIIAFFPVMLGGCVAAAIPLMLAASGVVEGFAIFKTVQMTTGGTVSVSFGKDKLPVGVQKQLVTIKQPAIWPGDEVAVAMTEEIQKEGTFHSVITPAVVTKSLKESKIDPDMKNLTRSEKMALFGKVCTSTGADGIIVLLDEGDEADSNIWSLNRSAVIHHAKLIIYGSDAGSVVYETEMLIKEEVTGNIQNPQEVMRIAGASAAEKIRAIMGGKEG